MKILEDYINRQKKKDFYCEVNMSFAYMTKEVEKLIELIDEAHREVFPDDYKTYVVVESDNASFRTIE